MPLTLLGELVLVLLNDESGYLENVNFWNLECCISGAVLGDLALRGRIDLDLKQLTVVDPAETGDDILDPVLAEVVADGQPHSAQYWIEKLATGSGVLLERVLQRHERRGLLRSHSGGFWSRDKTGPVGTAAVAEPRARILKIVFSDEVLLEPRDILLIGLVDACRAFQFMMEPDELEARQERIDFLGNLDLIGQAIKASVRTSYVSLTAARSTIARKPIPTIRLKDLLAFRRFNGNPAPFCAHIHDRYGPVARIHAPPLPDITLLTGADTNAWLNRNARLFFHSKRILFGMEQVFGATRTLPGLDGAEHYRLRRLLRRGYSRTALEERVPELHALGRESLAAWQVGKRLNLAHSCRTHMMAVGSQVMLSMDVSKYFEDTHALTRRALAVHVQRSIPKFMLKTPAMRKKYRRTMELVAEARNHHMPSRRIGERQDLLDLMLAVHQADQQALSEADLPFEIATVILAGMYIGAALGFSVHSLATHPEVFKQVQLEADELFADGRTPDSSEFTLDRIGVTHRVMLEALRMYPIIPVVLRHVMNECMVEGHRLPVGSLVVFGQSAPHYSREIYPHPDSFDIDRFAAPRNEHRRQGAFAPFGLGTHTCLAQHWVRFQLTFNLLLIAHHFDLEVPPGSRKMKVDPVPSSAPHSRMEFLVTRQRHKLAA